jgi:DNA repair exonuclease SbcCD ATPase subunit
MSLEEKYTESSQIVLQWINATESLLLSEEIKLTDLNEMKKQQKKLEECVEAAKSHEKSLEQIDSSSEAVCPEVGSLEELKSRYSEVKTLLEDRQTQIQACKNYLSRKWFWGQNSVQFSLILQRSPVCFKTVISQVQQWQDEIQSLETWLEEVDIFVCSETPAIGDMEVLEAQLEQSNVMTTINGTGMCILFYYRCMLIIVFLLARLYKVM